MKLPDGGRYKGQWNEETEKRHGRGTQVWQDGTVYEGHWKDDKAHGKGRIISMENSLFNGSIFVDKLSNGTLRSSQTDVSFYYYEG